MKSNDKCPSCSSAETEIVYESETVFSVAKVAEKYDQKAGFEKFSPKHM